MGANAETFEENGEKSSWLDLSRDTCAEGASTRESVTPCYEEED